MNSRERFYRTTVLDMIKEKNASILVCGGGAVDKEIFESGGYTKVTISNLDRGMNKDAFHPFKWRYENAESLSCEDESFDFVVIHAAIHHASLPHKVLTEMYRVAKKGILAIEARDSFVMRILEKIGVTSSHEHNAVFYNDCRCGGVNNTVIPN